MRNIPVNLGGYALMVTEEPTMKTREKDGQTEVVTDRDGATVFTVSLLAKMRPRDGRRAPKGEEIRVTLATDPGEGFTFGSFVELIGGTVSPWEVTREDGSMASGLAFRAEGLTPAAAPVAA